ncbi:MAG: hypothetical protein JO247_10325 [Chloroflexi bacterium]|nr:hypothetical protein [Chloroflexota bacterium]
MATPDRRRAPARWVLIGATAGAAALTFGLVTASSQASPVFDPSSQQLQQPSLDQGGSIFSPSLRTRGS